MTDQNVSERLLALRAAKDAEQQKISDAAARDAEIARLEQLEEAEREKARQSWLSDRVQGNQHYLAKNREAIAAWRNHFGEGQMKSMSAHDWWNAQKGLFETIQATYLEQQLYRDRSVEAMEAMPVERFKPRMIDGEEFQNVVKRNDNRLGGMRARFQDAVTAEQALLAWWSESVSDSQRLGRASVCARFLGYMPGSVIGAPSASGIVSSIGLPSR
jgi:hypothetical protein